MLLRNGRRKNTFFFHSWAISFLEISPKWILKIGPPIARRATEYPKWSATTISNLKKLFSAIKMASQMSTMILSTPINSKPPTITQIHGDWEDRWHFGTIYNDDHSGGGIDGNIAAGEPPSSTSMPGPVACTGHQSQLRQQEPLATRVSGRHRRTCSLRSDHYPLLQTCHQAHLLRHSTPCRHSADLPASWKLKESYRGANVQSAERTRSCKELWLVGEGMPTYAQVMQLSQLHHLCVRWHSFSHVVSSWRLHTHLPCRLVTSIYVAYSQSGRPRKTYFGWAYFQCWKLITDDHQDFNW